MDRQAITYLWFGYRAGESIPALGDKYRMPRSEVREILIQEAIDHGWTFPESLDSTEKLNWLKIQFERIENQYSYNAQA